MSFKGAKTQNERKKIENFLFIYSLKNQSLNIFVVSRFFFSTVYTSSIVSELVKMKKNCAQMVEMYLYRIGMKQKDGRVELRII